jgi:cysteine desulfurase / selenocysteine lyase
MVEVRAQRASKPNGLLPELEVVRKDFPILQRQLAGGQPLVYLDSANTSQKPQVVIDAMVDHLERHNANIARAMHQLGAESTEAFEAARDKVAAFLGAPERDEVIFTKNASEALNLAAQTIPLGPGDRVVITEMEHHSNIVPWQMATQRSGAELRWFGLTDDGHLDLSNLEGLITEQTKVVSLTWVSNMLGTINPIAEIAKRAHAVGALVVVDASQAAPQLPIDLAAMPVEERPAQPAELAPAFVFLASDDSSFMTGEVVGVTGGRLAPFGRMGCPTDWGS